MALVKKSKIETSPTQFIRPATPKKSPVVAPTIGPRKSKLPGDGESAVERLAAATEELASGLTEAATATGELARAMEQVAGGAETAAGTSQRSEERRIGKGCRSRES